VVLLRAATVHFALAEVSEAEVFGAQALSMLLEVLGPIAGARVLGLERIRTSRIWSAAGWHDVVSWLDVTWAAEKLETKDLEGETSAEEQESVISTSASEVLEESAISAEGQSGDVTPRRSNLEVQTTPPLTPERRSILEVQTTPPLTPERRSILEVQTTPPLTPARRSNLEVQTSPPLTPERRSNLEVQTTQSSPLLTPEKTVARRIAGSVVGNDAKSVILGEVPLLTLSP